MKRAPESPSELRDRALRLLGRREHSRAELAGKLAPQAGSSDTLARVLDALEVRKQLSDERYAEERARQLGRKYGAERVRRDLLARGVAQTTAERLAAVQARGDVERARAILERKFRESATTPRERARRARFLRGRGFSAEAIGRVLGFRTD